MLQNAQELFVADDEEEVEQQLDYLYAQGYEEDDILVLEPCEIELSVSFGGPQLPDRLN